MPVFFNLLQQFCHSPVIDRLGLQNRRYPCVIYALASAGFEHKHKICKSPIRSLSIRFVNHKQVPCLENSGFYSLDIITHTGYEHDNRSMCISSNFHFILAYPHGLHDDIVLAHSIQYIDGPSRGLGQTPKMPPCSQGTDKNSRVAAVPLHPDPISQQGAAAEGTGGINRDNPYRFFHLPHVVEHSIDEAAFPHARCPCDAYDICPACVWIELLQDLPHTGCAVINITDQAGRGPYISGQHPFRGI